MVNCRLARQRHHSQRYRCGIVAEADLERQRRHRYQQRRGRLGACRILARQLQHHDDRLPQGLSSAYAVLKPGGEHLPTGTCAPRSSCSSSRCAETSRPVKRTVSSSTARSHSDLIARLSPFRFSRTVWHEGKFTRGIILKTLSAISLQGKLQVDWLDTAGNLYEFVLNPLDQVRFITAQFYLGSAAQLLYAVSNPDLWSAAYPVLICCAALHCLDSQLLRKILHDNNFGSAGQLVNLLDVCGGCNS